MEGQVGLARVSPRRSGLASRAGPPAAAAEEDPRGTHLSVAVRGGWLIEAADGGYSSFHLLLGSAAARGRQVRRNALIFPSYLSPARGRR